MQQFLAICCFSSGVKKNGKEDLEKNEKNEEDDYVADVDFAAFGDWMNDKECNEGLAFTDFDNHEASSNSANFFTDHSNLQEEVDRYNQKVNNVK